MAKISPDNTNDKLAHSESSSEVAEIICGVGRKANIGNYETVDVYFSVRLPIPNINGLMSPEELQPIIDDAAATGFALASRQVNDRYAVIKNI